MADKPKFTDETRYFQRMIQPLLGGVIIGTVATDYSNEVLDFDPQFYGLKIRARDKKVYALYFLSDEEGNNVGGFEIQELTPELIVPN